MVNSDCDIRHNYLYRGRIRQSLNRDIHHAVVHADERRSGDDCDIRVARGEGHEACHVETVGRSRDSSQLEGRLTVGNHAPRMRWANSEAVWGGVHAIEVSQGGVDAVKVRRTGDCAKCGSHVAIVNWRQHIFDQVELSVLNAYRKSRGVPHCHRHMRVRKASRTDGDQRGRVPDSL